jgi:hypothetical protein
MCTLIRNLHMSRMFESAGMKGLCAEIFVWARRWKLYRLAEAALHALEKFDIKKATKLCLECLTSPIESTILAIAAIRMIPRLDWELDEPKVIDLIGHTPDPYLLLNLIDSLSFSTIKTSVELIIMLLSRLVFEKDQELLFKLSGILSTRADYDILDSLMKMCVYADEQKKPVILRLIGSLSFDKEFAKNVGLNEFLARVLRDDKVHNKLQASILLYKLEDDSSVKAVMKLIKTANVAVKTEIVRGLRGILRSDLLPVMLEFLREDSGVLHEALRETLLSIEDREARSALIECVLKAVQSSRETETTRVAPAASGTSSVGEPADNAIKSSTRRAAPSLLSVSGAAGKALRRSTRASSLGFYVNMSPFSHQ